ncbi:MAG: hypothetical protein AB7U82_31770 [Blastocatellales bacterium]
MIKRTVRIEHAEPGIDFTLGLPNQCIAFRKEAADDREWNFHHDF